MPTKNVECRRPFGQLSTLMVSGFTVLIVHCGRNGKPSLGLVSAAIGTIITTRIAPMKRLVALQVEVMVLNFDGGTKPSKNCLVMRNLKTLKTRIIVAEEDKKIPTVFWVKIDLVSMTISTSRTSLTRFSR